MIKTKTKLYLILIIVFVFILLLSEYNLDNNVTVYNNKTTLYWKSSNYNKPWVNGIVLDVHKGVTAQEYGNHPLLSWVLLREKWSVINPAKGVYNWSTLDEKIAEWNSYGKKIIISISPMGQDKLEDAHTPAWIYNEGVKKISYKRNNKPDSILITVPKTWDEDNKSYDKKYFKFYSDVVKKLGEKYRNDERVGAIVVAIGHLGAMTANPNPNGAIAFKENGWKVEYYENFVDSVVNLYKKEFPNKRLFINPTPLIIFEKNPPPGHTEFYRDVMISKSKQIAQDGGISLWAIGVDENESNYIDTGIPYLLSELSLFVMEDNHQQGIGDDWPMYSPQFKKEGLRRDINDFKKCIEHAIGGTGNVPKSRVSFISFLESTLKATYPGHPDFNPEVYNITLWALKNLEKHPHDSTPPILSSGSPNGTLPQGITQINISLKTNKPAICKYSTTPNINYQAMPNIFSITGSTTHSQLITGLKDNTTYNFYVRCRDNYNNTNTNDYLISFYVNYSNGQSQCIHEADTDCNGKINIQELIKFIRRWKNNQTVTVIQLLQIINLWKSGI